MFHLQAIAGGTPALRGARPSPYFKLHVSPAGNCGRDARAPRCSPSHFSGHLLRYGPHQHCWLQLVELADTFGEVPILKGPLVASSFVNTSPPSSPHLRIFKGVLWVSAFVLLAKLAGAGMNMAVAWRYGTATTVDAYLLLTTYLYWPMTVWLSVLTTVLIPLVARMRGSSPEVLRQFQGELFGLTLAIGVVLAVAVFGALPSIVPSVFSGIAEETQREALYIGKPLLFVLPLGLACSLASAWLIALGRHRNTLLEGVPSLILIAAVLAPAGSIPDPLIWGTLAGVTAQLALLLWPLHQLGQFSAPRIGLRSPLWREFRAGIGIILGSQLVMSFTAIIDQSFAAHQGPGAVSTFGYATRVMSLLTSMGALAISRATMPIFSEFAAAGQTAAIRSIVVRWSLLLSLVALVVGSAFWIAAPEIVNLLFQRGRFTPENSVAVSSVLRFLLLQLPFYTVGLLYSSALASKGQYRDLFATSVIAILVKVALITALGDSLGIHGIALSTTGMYCATTLYMAVRILQWRSAPTSNQR